MKSINYISKHDFGYGRNPELETLNKIVLRNIEDLKVYINWAIKDIFDAKIENNNVINFFKEEYKVKINIQRLK